jgi:hypothetical protein
MKRVANDNIKSRTIEPFHRTFADQKLHRTPAVNTKLYYAGLRYKKSYFDAGGTLTAPPVYTASEYDEYRQVSRIPKSRPYFEAAKILDDLGLRELVEAIVINGRPVVDTGKRYTYVDRNQTEQARAAATTALGIGLRVLRNHYDGAAIEMAA